MPRLPIGLGIALVLAGAWLVRTEAYLKYGVRVNDRQVTLKWNTMPIRYYVNDQVPAGVSASAFREAVDRAFSSWAAVPTGGVRFQNAGSISAEPSEQDGASTIGFLLRPDLDRVLGATRYVVDTLTGEIVETDIFLNSAFPWSTAPGGDIGRFDVESIALHEIGHLVGLGHSALGETEVRATGGRRVIAAASVMFPIAFSAGSVEGRRLQRDDIAGVSDIYDGPGFAAGTGSISGRVTKEGRGVFGAHVVAFNPTTGALVGNFTLDDSGAFAIAGLEPGTHIIRVEPLDDADISSFFSDAQAVDLRFAVTYLDKLVVVPRGGNAGPIEIKVAAR